MGDRPVFRPVLKEKRARPSGKDTNRAPGQLVSLALGP